jgi:NTP pyrophosphatase (non-canonical NTP hydrolase)
MKKLQEKIKEFSKERNWDALHPSDLVKSISIESAELLELYQWGRQDISKIKTDNQLLQKTRDEVGDVVLCAFQLASLLDFDLGEAVKNKLEKVIQKYPAEKVRQDNNFVQKQKEKYRREGRN